MSARSQQQCALRMLLSLDRARAMRKLGPSASWEWHIAIRIVRLGSPRHEGLGLMAALSHEAHFSVGCYCADEALWHRSVSRALLLERGATVATW